MSRIQFEHVSKKFRIQHYRARSVRETILDAIRGASYTSAEFSAVHDLSFSIAPGETVGIIGGNGSGKSTILKLIARVIEPSSGKIAVDGSIHALLELGASFHPDYTGRENLFLFGSYHGLSRREINARYEDIVAFSELAEFIDQPVRQYSTGMHLRLAMSVATVFEPDILIVDELLAVGDQRFQSKCLARLTDLKHRGTTIVLVSHDLPLVRRLCTRVIWMQRGWCRGSGDPDEIVHAYLTSLAEDTLQAPILTGDSDLPNGRLGRADPGRVAEQPMEPVAGGGTHPGRVAEQPMEPVAGGGTRA